MARCPFGHGGGAYRDASLVHSGCARAIAPVSRDSEEFDILISSVNELSPNNMALFHPVSFYNRTKKTGSTFERRPKESEPTPVEAVATQ